MKFRKLIAAGCALAMLLGMTLTSYAEEGETEPETGLKVVFDGSESLKYEGGDPESFGEAFQNILPGEVKTETIELENRAQQAAEFYLSSQTVKDLIGEGAAAYDVKLELTKGEAEPRVLYEVSVGGEGSKGLEELTGKNGNMYLETLNPQESASLSLTIGLDGETGDNAYMVKTGFYQFNFVIEYADKYDHDTTREVTNVQTITQVLPEKVIKQQISDNGVAGERVDGEDSGVLGERQGASTGDETPIGLYVGILAAVVILLVAVLIIKKKREEK